MVYRPPVKKSEYQGTKGAAHVALNGNRTKAKVIFFNDVDGTPDKQYIVILNTCPKEVQGYIHSGDFIVNMNKDGDKIYSMYPYNGMFEVKCAKFSSKKDQPPAPLTKFGKNEAGQSYSYLFFVTLNEILSGEDKGMQIPLFLRYDFSEEEQEIDGVKKKVTGYSKQFDKSKHVRFLDEYLVITGAWKYGPIPYSDNILPKLEGRIGRAAAHFKVIVKKGYIDTLYQGSFVPNSEKPKEEPEPDNDFADGASFDGEDLTDDPTTEETTADKFE